MYDFQQYKTIRSFGDIIYTGKTIIDETGMDQTNLLEIMLKFNNKSRPRSKEDMDKKRNTFHSVNFLQEGQELRKIN